MNKSKLHLKMTQFSTFFYYYDAGNWNSFIYVEDISQRTFLGTSYKTKADSEHNGITVSCAKKPVIICIS